MRHLVTSALRGLDICGLSSSCQNRKTSAVAAKAYDVLNTYILTEYTGSLGTRVPPDVQEHLDDLRRLRGGS